MNTNVTSQVSPADLFDLFIDATTMHDVLSLHHQILDYSSLSPKEFNSFYPKFKKQILSNREGNKNWKAKALFAKIDKKSYEKCYSNARMSSPSSSQPIHSSDSSDSSSNSETYESTNNVLSNYSCLVIGCGPAGLRTAIELQFLGASKVLIAEKRNRFSRNNVLHLWPFVIDDLKSLGAKKLYGCDVRESCSYISLCPDTLKLGSPSGDINSESNHNIPEKCQLTLTEIDYSSVISNQEDEDDKCDYNIKEDHVIPVSLRPLTTISPLNLEESSGDDKRSNNEVKSKDDAVKKVINIQKNDLPTRGIKAHFHCDFDFQEEELHSYNWDIVIGADGRRNTLSEFFPRKEFRGRLAIAITANFINRQTPTEAAIPEISGLSYIYNQEMFNELAYDTNIMLENVCYYKDDTHYFVMTAKKASLLHRGVLKRDFNTTHELLADSNVDRAALLQYAKDAAFWTTGLDPLNFALNHYGQEDCAMFDFTSMYAASNASKALRTRNGGLVLIGLVGDTLLEPFWPTGSGCGRGFLSSFDAAWMCRQWAVSRCALSEDNVKLQNNYSYDKMALHVLAERESIYRILGQTTSENLQSNYKQYSLIPYSRYPNLNKYLVTPQQVEHLLSDRQESLDEQDLKNRKSQKKTPKRVKSLDLPKCGQNSQPSGIDISLRRKHFVHALSESCQDSMSNFDYQELYNDVDISRARSIENVWSGFNLSSSNNSVSIEARTSEDSDDCMLYTRQKNQLSFIRDKLSDTVKNNECYQVSEDMKHAAFLRLSKELRRARDRQSRNGFKDGMRGSLDIQPLDLLNSMRKGTSFAERVKSFESKLGPSNVAESEPSTTRIHMDNVRNLPQFAALQRLLKQDQPKQSRNLNRGSSKIPIMKLSKEDWNVKCWEERVASYKTLSKRHGSFFKSFDDCESINNYRKRTMQRAMSVDLPQCVVEKKAGVFQDRIEEIARKLKTSSGSSLNSYKENDFSCKTRNVRNKDEKPIATIHRNRGGGINGTWINHLKQELALNNNKTSLENNDFVLNRRPVKKLFEYDDVDENADQHFDHLCIKRPTNKYLPKIFYTSHMRRGD